MSFGRKGLTQLPTGQGARPAGGFGVAPAQAPVSDDPYAEAREAFLAEERARREGTAPAGPAGSSRPAGGPQPVAFKSGYKSNRSDFRTQVSDWTDRRFGLPHQRRMMMAYFLLLMVAPVSLHRFYCGEYTTGMLQVGLFGGGMLLMVVFPPLGLAALAFRGFWVFFDFLMIPGMLQRLKDRSGTGPSVMV